MKTRNVFAKLMTTGTINDGFYDYGSFKIGSGASKGAVDVAASKSRDSRLSSGK